MKYVASYVVTFVRTLFKVKTRLYNRISNNILPLGPLVHMAVTTTRCLFIYVVLLGDCHRSCYAHAVAVLCTIFLAAMTQSTCTAAFSDQHLGTSQGRSTASSEKKGNVRLAKSPETSQAGCKRNAALGVAVFFFPLSALLPSMGRSLEFDLTLVSRTC